MGLIVATSSAQTRSFHPSLSGCDREQRRGVRTAGSARAHSRIARINGAGLELCAPSLPHEPNAPDSGSGEVARVRSRSRPESHDDDDDDEDKESSSSASEYSENPSRISAYKKGVVRVGGGGCSCGGERLLPRLARHSLRLRGRGHPARRRRGRRARARVLALARRRVEHTRPPVAALLRARTRVCCYKGCY